MTVDKNMSEPKNCLHCGSENIIGPYHYIGAFARITFFTSLVQKVFICVDCGYTMLFTRDGQERKIRREAARQNHIQYEF